MKKKMRRLVRSHQEVASIAVTYLSRFEAIMIGPAKTENDACKLCESVEAEGWLVFGISKERKAEEIQICFFEKSQDVARCLVEVIAKSDLPVGFSNGIDGTFYPSGMMRLCDALADFTWDEIDRHHPELPDDPEGYAKVADEHPIDELRSDLGETITYFDGSEDAARQRLVEMGVSLKTAEKYLKIERERS